MAQFRKPFEMREMLADLTVMRLRADRLGLVNFSELLSVAALDLKNSLLNLDVAQPPTLWGMVASSHIEDAPTE
jgi:hypothetical protein